MSYVKRMLIMCYSIRQEITDYLVLLTDFMLYFELTANYNVLTCSKLLFAANKLR